MSNLMERIALRFQSGNGVPVERAHITAAEWEELRRDADRLDWLASQFRTCTVYMSGQHPYSPSHRLRDLRGPTFRAAIDAARGAEG